MLTLVFLRFIGEKYEDGIEKLRQTLIEQGLNPEDENIRSDIVNITLHFFLKRVESYATFCSEA